MISASARSKVRSDSGPLEALGDTLRREPSVNPVHTDIRPSPRFQDGKPHLPRFPPLRASLGPAGLGTHTAFLQTTSACSPEENPKQNEKQDPRQVRRPHRVPRVSKAQQQLKALGIFLTAFAKQADPYLKQRSEAQ